MNMSHSMKDRFVKTLTKMLDDWMKNVTSPKTDAVLRNVLQPVPKCPDENHVKCRVSRFVSRKGWVRVTLLSRHLICCRLERIKATRIYKITTKSGTSNISSYFSFTSSCTSRETTSFQFLTWLYRYCCPYPSLRIVPYVNLGLCKATYHQKRSIQRCWSGTDYWKLNQERNA